MIGLIVFLIATIIYRRQKKIIKYWYYQDLKKIVDEKNQSIFSRIDMHVILDDQCRFLVVEQKYLSDTGLEALRSRAESQNPTTPEKSLTIAIGTNSHSAKKLSEIEENQEGRGNSDGKFDASAGVILAESSELQIPTVKLQRSTSPNQISRDSQMMMEEEILDGRRGSLDQINFQFEGEMGNS